MADYVSGKQTLHKSSEYFKLLWFLSLRIFPQDRPGKTGESRKVNIKSLTLTFSV